MPKRDVRNDQNRPAVKRPTRRERAMADWGMIAAENLREAIATVTAGGGALRFGYTRDGGAYSLGIYGLGEPYTEYLRPGDDVGAFLHEVATAFVDGERTIVGTSIPLGMQAPVE